MALRTNETPPNKDPNLRDFERTGLKITYKAKNSTLKSNSKPSYNI